VVSESGVEFHVHLSATRASSDVDDLYSEQRGMQLFIVRYKPSVAYN
jgi:hypothetical protein